MIGAIGDVLGRSAAYLVLYAAHSFAYFGIVYPLYGFPQQASLTTLAAFGLPFLLAVIFLGLTLRTFFRERETAIQVLLFMSLPAIFLAGFAWPAEAVPAWLRHLAALLPSTTGIAGFLRLTQMGASLAQVRSEWLTLVGLMLGYFAASVAVARPRRV